MKNFLPLLAVSAFLVCSCNSNKSKPDISGIEVKLQVERFDQDFFAIDTTNTVQSVDEVAKKHPAFFPVFMQQIAGLSEPAAVNAFYRFYKPVFDSAQDIYKNIEPLRKEIETAFRYVKYYFPEYQLPSKLVTIVGPMDSPNDMARMQNGDYTPNFIGPDLLGVSLQYYLGKDFSWYRDAEFVNNIVPRFRSRRFSKEYIISDVMRLIADDVHPDNSGSLPLAERMIGKGKYWWLIDKFLPGHPDSVKTGYTAAQLQWCRENEGFMWSYIVKNENLFTIDPRAIQTYIGEGPFTNVFPQEYSPGNIGPWIGWQIIKKFEEKHPELSPADIMKVPPKQILDEAKYKPK